MNRGVKEEVLHFIWKWGKFNHKNLRTTDNREIIILQKGFHNKDSGPDFSQARLKIGDTFWAGQVEIHVKASEWNKHLHQFDKAYNNTILHVVWEEDEQVFRSDFQPMPTLELKNRVEEGIFEKCHALMQSLNNIPCFHWWEQFQEIDKSMMLHRVLAERMIDKSSRILETLEIPLKGDWQTACYLMVAKYMGGTANAEVMFELAKKIPLKWVYRLGGDIEKVEALFFGTAGFLAEKKESDYSAQLAKEFSLLKLKFGIEEMKVEQWKFMRMRPNGFPTFRIAQLCDWVIKSEGFYSRLIENQKIEKYRDFFQMQASEYWKTHYRFGVFSGYHSTHIGEETVNRLLINAVAPILLAYGYHSGREKLKEHAFALLESIPSEKNKITKMWKEKKIKMESAYDSQAWVGLYTDWCLKRKCLDCGMGLKILSGDVFLP